MKLFRRVGRNIRLTDVGQIAFRYADQIFGLGRELTHALKGWTTDGPLGERNALIEPEEVVFFWFQTGGDEDFRVRLVLDYDSDVIELPAEFVRQESEGLGNQRLEKRFSTPL